PLPECGTPERFLPPERLLQFPGRCVGRPGPRHYWRRESDVGLGLPAPGVHVAKEPGDSGPNSGRRARGRESPDRRGERRPFVSVLSATVISGAATACRGRRGDGRERSPWCQWETLPSLYLWP